MNTRKSSRKVPLARSLRDHWGGWLTAAALGLVGTTGCHWGGYGGGPAYDPPFPIGAVTDAFWETQETNAEAADFIFFDHDFQGDTPFLTPAAGEKLMQMAIRFEHVPFPVVIEQGIDNQHPELDVKRYRMIVEQLARLGVQPDMLEGRVVIAPAFVRGYIATEAEQAYLSGVGSNVGGFGGQRFGGFGGTFR
jgi:hypothetical protein